MSNPTGDVDEVTCDETLRVLRWAGTTTPGAVLEQVVLLFEAGWLNNRQFMDRCVRPSDDDPERVAVVDWMAAADFLRECPVPETRETAALRLALRLVPARRQPRHPR